MTRGGRRSRRYSPGVSNLLKNDWPAFNMPVSQDCAPHGSKASVGLTALLASYVTVCGAKPVLTQLSVVLRATVSV
jgi:hypothetical protein